ncbi:hypothetical protein NC652_014043 [Populus alba x Populus x berolinensis]|uniref:Uncharacterized protein n=1 Tax=Populus alba x Populus x berolinensis TaxID=444605 RepID=A0AAD6QVZ8_9ROSI|nr:hypothetical protein NC652_014043 [Populus alba x Populus x berolinensis]KAJ6997629.1 hypothetical protein NC653_014014 [Populus alba x Populus x berolinensis]
MYIAFERIFLYVILALQTIMISCKLSVVERKGGIMRIKQIHLANDYFLLGHP